MLRGVDLEIRPGELVAIIGPSGSGKSTLLNLVGGLAAPDQGSVTLLGQELAALSDRARSALRNRAVGFIFQAFHLLEHLDVAENVALPAWFAEEAWSAEQRANRAAEVLETVGLEGLEGAPPRELSGGQRQRVAIARALFRDPPLILADEPTGNLDTVTGGGVLDMFEQLHSERGTSFIVVTHEHDVTQRAERTLRLVDGEIVS